MKAQIVNLRGDNNTDDITNAGVESTENQNLLKKPQLLKQLVMKETYKVPILKQALIQLHHIALIQKINSEQKPLHAQ